MGNLLALPFDSAGRPFWLWFVSLATPFDSAAATVFVCRKESLSVIIWNDCFHHLATYSRTHPKVVPAEPRILILLIRHHFPFSLSGCRLLLPCLSLGLPPAQDVGHQHAHDHEVDEESQAEEVVPPAGAEHAIHQRLVKAVPSSGSDFLQICVAITRGALKFR